MQKKTAARVLKKIFYNKENSVAFNIVIQDKISFPSASNTMANGRI